MVAHVGDAEPGPLGGVDVPVRYRRDADYLVTRSSQRIDRQPGTADSTLARLMRRHPTQQAAHEIGEALTALTSSTWPPARRPASPRC
jgi:hypothetical protein